MGESLVEIPKVLRRCMMVLFSERPEAERLPVFTNPSFDCPA